MSPLCIGNYYDHPEDGPVQVIRGDWEVNGRISNFWYWRVLTTGEVHHGYGDRWPSIENPHIGEAEKFIAMLYEACVTTEGKQTTLTDEQFDRLVSFLRRVGWSLEA